MTARHLVPLLLLSGSCFGQTPAGISARLKTEMEEKYKYTPQPKVEKLDQMPGSDDEQIVRLEPFTVTGFTSFRHDILEAARRAAAEKAAAKFSPLSGGLILDERFGPVDVKLGIWPMLIPYATDFTGKQGMRLSVDVIRINW